MSTLVLRPRNLELLHLFYCRLPLYMFYVVWCLRLTSHLLNEYDDDDDDDDDDAKIGIDLIIKLQGLYTRWPKKVSHCQIIKKTY